MRPNPPRSNAPAAGGCMLALGLIGGAIAGAMLGQPSKGFIVGGIAGVAVAVMLFLIDRRR